MLNARFPSNNVGPGRNWILAASIVGFVFLFTLLIFGITPSTSSSVSSLGYPTAVAGIVAALCIAWKRWRQVAGSLGIRSSAEDRFLAILGYLSSERLDLRLGALYALDRMATNEESDSWAIVELLTAYIRERSRPAGATTSGVPGIAKDVQAAIAILGRNAWRQDGPGQRRRDLSGADLRGAELSGFHFERAVFQDARLDHAGLTNASFDETVMSRACLNGANLDGASLIGAQLDHASLRDAVLRGATVTGADFTDADLRGADLTGAVGVTAAQIASAVTDSSTRFQVELADSAAWDVRVIELPEGTNGTTAPDAHRLLLHQCPKCYSQDVERNRWRRVTDPIVLKVFNRRSYECFACGAHFYDRPRTHRP